MLNGRSSLGNCLACAVPHGGLRRAWQICFGSSTGTGAVTRGAGWTRRHASSAVFVSPEVLPDKRVVFRLLGPQATDVAVQGVGRGRVPMVKGESGIWEATVGPGSTPGPYQYSFVVHGVQVPDPRNQATNDDDRLRQSAGRARLGHDGQKETSAGALAEVSSTPSVRRARSPRCSPLQRAWAPAPHARLHAAGIRRERRPLSCLLSSARFRRLGSVMRRPSAAPASSSTIL